MHRHLMTAAALVLGGAASLLPAQAAPAKNPKANEVHARIAELAKLLREDELDADARERARAVVAELQAMVEAHGKAAAAQQDGTEAKRVNDLLHEKGFGTRADEAKNKFAEA